jgi:hypothetical protein
LVGIPLCRIQRQVSTRNFEVRKIQTAILAPHRRSIYYFRTKLTLARNKNPTRPVVRRVILARRLRQIQASDGILRLVSFQSTERTPVTCQDSLPTTRLFPGSADVASFRTRPSNPSLVSDSPSRHEARRWYIS